MSGNPENLLSVREKESETVSRVAVNSTGSPSSVMSKLYIVSPVATLVSIVILASRPSNSSKMIQEQCF